MKIVSQKDQDRAGAPNLSEFASRGTSPKPTLGLSLGPTISPSSGNSDLREAHVLARERGRRQGFEGVALPVLSQHLLLSVE